MSIKKPKSVKNTSFFSLFSHGFKNLQNIIYTEKRNNDSVNITEKHVISIIIEIDVGNPVFPMLIVVLFFQK